ncbi:hypothetical protein RhiirB3_430953 [Rhizophagus irregularis]|nr:hypothetical protein RhiirB3_430953 [Rhizophagus irregularis]
MISFQEQIPEKSIQKTPSEDEVVEMVKKWRVNDETITNDHKKNNNERQETTLKNDNVEPDRVVEIINKFHENAKETKYERLTDTATDMEIVRKVKEIEEIYEDTDNRMEWEAINKSAIEMTQHDMKIPDRADALKKWLRKDQDNITLVSKTIVSLAEKQDILDNYLVEDDGNESDLLNDENGKNEDRKEEDENSGQQTNAPNSPE